jgi:hypothetical protein
LTDAGNQNLFRVDIQFGEAAPGILQLDPAAPDKSISFLMANDVLFFLHKSNELYTGNENFSFTLNRKN